MLVLLLFTPTFPFTLRLLDGLGFPEVLCKFEEAIGSLCEWCCYDY